MYAFQPTNKPEYGMSLDAQRAELERYCHGRAGLGIIDVYVDGGFRQRHRPSRLPAHAAARQTGEINGIVVAKLDRLTRSIRNSVSSARHRPLNVEPRLHPRWQ